MNDQEGDNDTLPEIIEPEPAEPLPEPAALPMMPVAAINEYFISKGQRGNDIIWYQGYSYNFHKLGKRAAPIDNDQELDRSIKYYCCKRHKRSCYAVLYVDKLRICSTNVISYANFRVSQPHEENCVPVAHALEHTMTTALIHTSVAIGTPFRDAYDQAVSIGPNPLRNANPEAAATYVSAHSIIRTSQRRASERFPTQNPPAIASTIMFPEHWKHICGNHLRPRFLQIQVNFVIHGIQHSILVFGTEANFRRLCSSDTWYMDGTFKACPVLFKQLFTLHYFVGKRAFPALYCLLTGKSEAVYTRLFQEIRDLAVRLAIIIVTTKVMADYEQAIRNAIAAVWLLWIVEGCLFHFTKCLREKVEALGLKVCILKVNTIVTSLGQTLTEFYIYSRRHRTLTIMQKQVFVT